MAVAGPALMLILLGTYFKSRADHEQNAGSVLGAFFIMLALWIYTIWQLRRHRR